MVQLTFYGGIREIGGNKILLEDGDRRLLLDFGFPYKTHKLFFEEYLKPRGGAGLLDPLRMGLLPPVEGLYREDLAPAGLWAGFRGAKSYRAVDQVDGVLLTHAHLDHSAHISFLREDIPVYSTALTAFMTKAIQDSGKADFDQQVCYFGAYQEGCPTGWTQGALLSRGDSKKQRRFCLGDMIPSQLSEAAVKFWGSGFWEKESKGKEMASCSLTGHDGCASRLMCFPVDHSIRGGCAWAIETGSGWVVYSGDLRMHGKRGALTAAFAEAAAKLRPKAMIIEGTNVGRPANISEQDVYQNGVKAIAAAKGLVIADFPARDLDRLLTFLQIAKDSGRKLVILARDAYMLKTIRLLDSAVPDIAREDSLCIYQDTTASKYPAVWMRKIFEEYSNKMVLAKDVRADQDRYILSFSFFDLNELPSIAPKPGGLYVFSSSEPHDEEQEIDFRRLHNWLKHFEIRGFGLPQESNGGWSIPEAERGLHASGHACGPDLLEIVNRINPEILIPVHSEHPEFYAEKLRNSGIKVVLPDPGETITM